VGGAVFLTLPETLVIFAEITGVSQISRPHLRDLGLLESAIAQPMQTFDGRDLYPSLEEKAAALLHSLCQNQPFIDGNKRVAFVAMRTFLRMNERDIAVDTYEAIEFMLSVARGEIGRDKIAWWIAERLCRYEG
jgi:death-on-curing protein